jgi:hypothetical protein
MINDLKEGTNEEVISRHGDHWLQGIWMTVLYLFDSPGFSNKVIFITLKRLGGEIHQ